MAKNRSGNFEDMMLKGNTQQHGFTLMELLLVAAVMSGLMVMMVQSTLRGVQDIRDQAVVHNLKRVEEAMGLYVADHHADIKQALNLNENSDDQGGLDLDGNGQALNTQDLINEGYLQSGFRQQNAYGQSYAFIVHRPSDDTLEFMVYTTGGDAISENRAAGIAAQIGASGGVFEQNSGLLEVQGAFGGWRVQNNDWSSSWGAPSNAEANRLATLNTSVNGEIISNHLSRVKVEGEGSEPNTMRTALLMEDSINMMGYDINNAGAITAASLGVSGTITAGSSFTIGGNNGTKISENEIKIGGNTIINSSNIFANGAINGNSLNISGTLTASGFEIPGHPYIDTQGDILAKGTLDAVNIETNRFLVDGKITATGMVKVAGIVSATTLVITNQNDATGLRIASGISVNDGPLLKAEHVRALKNILQTNCFGYYTRPHSVDYGGLIAIRTDGTPVCRGFVPKNHQSNSASNDFRHPLTYADWAHKDKLMRDAH